MEKRWYIIKPYVICMGIAILICYILFFVWHPVIVTGSSMYPTYKDGEIVLSKPINDKTVLQIGDVVVFNIDNHPYIKRIVALPGDTISCYGGFLFRNGVKIDDGFPLMDDGGILDQKITLEGSQYFCMGDNRNNSIDCRQIGPITKKNIKYLIQK